MLQGLSDFRENKCRFWHLAGLCRTMMEHAGEKWVIAYKSRTALFFLRSRYYDSPMPRFTHRPTWADDPEHRDTDRVVYRDGLDIGRITYIPDGKEKGRWQWSTVWSGIDSGAAESKEAALENIRTSYETWERSDPEQLKIRLGLHHRG